MDPDFGNGPHIFFSAEKKDICKNFLLGESLEHHALRDHRLVGGVVGQGRVGGVG